MSERVQRTSRYLKKQGKLITFREYISNVNKSLSDTNPLEITILNLEGRGLKDIEGIQKFTNLKELNLSKNEIRNLNPLKALVNLEWVNLSHNRIISVKPLSELGNLEYLSLGFNNISDAGSIANLTQLKKLYLSNNQPLNYSFLEKLSDLQELYLPAPEDLDISAIRYLTNLEILGLEKPMYLSTTKKEEYLNSFLDISPVSDLQNLRVLELFYDFPISGLDQTYINNLEKLTVLRESFNDKNFDLAFLKSAENLKELFLAGPVKSYKPISYLKNLNKLNFYGDRDGLIENIDFLYPLTSLKELYISRAKLDDISGLNGLVNLEILDLSRCNLSNIDGLIELKGLRKLKVLNISNNQITDIAPLLETEWLDEGCELNLAGNPLNDKSKNLYIKQLEAKGVDVRF